MKVTACVLAALMTGCASLPREQMTYEVTYQALHVVDTIQTLRIRKTPGTFETNLILGKRPTDAEVIAYMAAEAVAHAYITKAMADRGAPMWLQRAWHYASVTWNGRLVIYNHRRGL